MTVLLQEEKVKKRVSVITPSVEQTTVGDDGLTEDAHRLERDRSDIFIGRGVTHGPGDIHELLYTTYSLIYFFIYTTQKKEVT